MFTAAGYLGLAPAALRAALLKGETLADVAKAQGKTVDGLVAAMVSAQKTRLETAVTNGFLTGAQAARIESTMEQRLTAIVNGAGRPGFRAFGGAGSSTTPTPGATA